MGASTVDDEAQRYSRRSILRSERMYGYGFQSPGGLPMMEALCRRLPMARGMRILDVGSGLGGAAFHFAERHGASVVGVDPAPAMIALSTERMAQRKLTGIRFVEADIRTAPLPADGFDLVWSRDSVLYVAEKALVWRVAITALRPGGSLLVTDFCRGADAASAEFEAYLENCGYHLQHLDAYAGGVAAAGFEVLAKEDMTTRFVESLEHERREIVRTRRDFLRDFDESDYEYLTTRWEKKLRFCAAGGLKYGLIVARRPEGR
jgi:phosphoethanolamine N-methyltransferase